METKGSRTCESHSLFIVCSFPNVLISFSPRSFSPSLLLHSSLFTSSIALLSFISLHFAAVFFCFFMLMNQNTNDTGGQLHNEAELCLSFFLLAFSPQMPLVCLFTSSSSSSSCPHSLSSFPLHLSSSPFLLLSFCHFPLDTPSISPSLHLFSRLSLLSCSHRNCWVIPLTGTAQLIGLNSFWQILSLSSCSPCFSKYGFVIIFSSSILTPYLPCPSSPFSFSPSSSLLSCSPCLCPNPSDHWLSSSSVSLLLMLGDRFPRFSYAFLCSSQHFSALASRGIISGDV